MNKIIAKFFAKARDIVCVFGWTFKFIFQGFKEGTSSKNLRITMQLIFSHLHEYRSTLEKFCERSKRAQFAALYSDKSIDKMQAIASGLHKLMPEPEKYSYSVILIVDETGESNFENLLQSLVNQSPPKMEILVGLKSLSYAAGEITERISQKNPGIIRVIKCEGLSKSTMFNELAKLASGDYLVLADQLSWFRPDFLYRYEQVLRLHAETEKLILYCREEHLDESGKIIGQSLSTRGKSLYFPYLFINFFHGGLLVSKSLWNELGGYREDASGAEMYDFVLRADLQGVHFIQIPISLAFSLQKERSLYNEKIRSSQAEKSLRSYLKQRELNWKISEGYSAESLKVSPPVEKCYRIHAIVPYKDQKKLTLDSLASLLKQEGVQVCITAVDNRSEDRSIQKEIEALGAEVIYVDEPFNFSRLNNLAVKRSKKGSDCDLLFFMNNDVELQKNALLEMCRWIDKPKIGMVGCRLHYPDGLLQCGGVDLNGNWPVRLTGWDIFEKKLSFDKLNEQRILRVSDGVNGASLLIKKDLFLELHGFEEIFYPIAHSDTNLAAKVAKKGLFSFYTPYAYGIHHESISREINQMEDFENTTWLDKLYFEKMPFIEKKNAPFLGA